MTTRHLLTCFREHKSRSSGPIKKHFAECTNSQIRLEDIDILTSTIKSDTHLLALEALYIRELKPYLNTQNAKEQEFKSWQLRISFWFSVVILSVCPCGSTIMWIMTSKVISFSFVYLHRWWHHCRKIYLIKDFWNEHCLLHQYYCGY